MHKIRFGTSGWRGVFCEDFTLDNVRVVTQAIADYLRSRGLQTRGLVVGHDSRFLGEKFARETACVLAGDGIPSCLCNRDTPTPAIAFEIIRRRAAGGINFTASHNPADYNGMKFSPASGGPALPEVTEEIERRANAMLGEICYRAMPIEDAFREGLIEEIDARPAYQQAVAKLADLQAIGRSGMGFAVNPLYGTSRGYLDRMLREAGARVVCINACRDPYFGGFPPEPARNYIGDFINLVKGDDSITIGLATDGDADRFGILDGDGTFIEPNYFLALLYDYLIQVRGMRGAAARSVATSHFIDAVAAYHGYRVHETPVGFKYIGELIRSGQILLGGEESAGLTIAGHVPEKDGILACLLAAEMVAVTGKSLSMQLQDLYKRVGSFHTQRKDIRLSAAVEETFADKMAILPDSIGGWRVTEVVTVDGWKFMLENEAWILLRKSGTEPVVRLYCEARSEKDLEHLVAAARNFIAA
jgi:alpha-D-glucose phosphate-specific phosphoglucomutase